MSPALLPRDNKLVRPRLGVLTGLWMLALLLFPITTPPFVGIGNVVAKPLSFFPVLLLLLLASITGNRRVNHIISVEMTWLVGFAMVAVATGLVHWGFVDLAMSAAGFDNYIRALPTLMIGLSFYMAFRIMNLTRQELVRSEMLIMSALMVSIGVELIQLAADKFFPFLTPLVELINSLFVEVAISWSGRYHGLAYEPSWLADQLILIALPLSLSRVLSGESYGEIRLPLRGVNFKIENFFLAMTVVGIFISGSRTGIVGALLVFGVSGLMYGARNKHRLLSVRSIGGVVALVGLFGGGLLYALSNDYVVSMAIAVYSASTIEELVHWASFGTRASVWFSSFQVFLENPVMGVGLGGAELYYYQFVPEWILDVPEAQSWLAGFGRANSKNMILRLLAETGLVGAIFFFAFVFLHFRGKGGLRHSYLKAMMAIAFVVISFQSDSFALPTMWFALGFLLLHGKLAKEGSVAGGFRGRGGDVQAVG